MLFAYEAQNEDELTLKEGEIINIITKVSGEVRLVFQFVLGPIHLVVVSPRPQFQSLLPCCVCRSVRTPAGGWVRSAGGKASSPTTS